MLRVGLLFFTIVAILQVPTAYGSIGTTVDYEEDEEMDEVLEDAHDDYMVKHPDFNETASIDGGIKVELDILTEKGDYEKLLNETESKRNAVIDSRFQWPNGVVAYTFKPDTFSDKTKKKIKLGMKDWEDETCVKFVDVGDLNVHKVLFMDGDGCYSWVGYAKQGSQRLSLGEGCVMHKIILHEIGHAVGFLHEQTRPDRDQYITIHTENIKSNSENNFIKYPWTVMNAHGVPYDLLSIMHYGKKAFSKNDKNTITTKDAAFQNVIGRQNKLSFRDVKMTNLMYKCASKCSPGKKCRGEGFVDKNCVCRCPGDTIRPTIPCQRTTRAPTTEAPTTRAPTTAAPTTKAPAAVNRVPTSTAGNTPTTPNVVTSRPTSYTTVQTTAFQTTEFE